MPIIISRTTDAPPVVTNPLTEQQREELWANIVRSYLQRHPEEFREMVRSGVPGTSTAPEPCGV